MEVFAGAVRRLVGAIGAVGFGDLRSANAGLRSFLRNGHGGVPHGGGWAGRKLMKSCSACTPCLNRAREGSWLNVSPQAGSVWSSRSPAESDGGVVLAQLPGQLQFGHGIAECLVGSRVQALASPLRVATGHRR